MTPREAHERIGDVMPKLKLTKEQRDRLLAEAAEGEVEALRSIKEAIDLLRRVASLRAVRGCETDREDFMCALTFAQEAIEDARRWAAAAAPVRRLARGQVA